MSCISSNFSSFFLDSLNDPSEFAKYLSNGENNKFSPFDDFQVFGTGGSSYNNNNTSQTQQQLQLQQQYSTQQNFNGNSSSNVPPYYNNINSNNNNNIISHNNNNNNVHVNSVNSNASSSSSSGSVVGGGAAASAGGHNHNNSEMYNSSIEANNFNQQQQQQQLPHPTSQQQQQQSHQQYVGHPQQQQQQPQQLPTPTTPGFHHNSTHLTLPHPHHPHAHPHPHPHALHPTTNPAQGYPNPVQRWPAAGSTHHHPAVAAGATPAGTPLHPSLPSCAGAQHFDGSFEFLKYLRHSNDYSATTGSTSTTGSPGDVNDASSNGGVGGAAATPTTATPSSASLIDLDTSTSMKPRSARKAAALLSSATRAVAALDTTLDVFDHDSKHTIFDLQHHITNSSNSNESMDVSNLAFPNSHLNASNSNTSSEGAAAGSSDFSNLNAASSNAPKPLVNFIINENFDVHPSHKVEEGIFQHMNKLPPKKKENLKQLGVRFTGQMTLSDKSIVVENFIKFCQEYEITDHRPFLSLNQSGLNKPEQIKFARYLGQGLPSFTLFCIYSNFKNLFCTKRTEIYTKDGYNLPYILDKTKRFLSNTTADLKNISQQQQQLSTDGLDSFVINNNPSMSSVELNKCMPMPKVLENFMVYENFDVHDTHRVEDGVCTHITRLPPKKQEILKQFGIQSNQSITHYEKYIIIENFIKFCNEYKISDHRPFLDFHESGLPKPEQVKFVRFLGQGLPNMTLNKIYLAFRDMLGINRIEKIMIDGGYNLEMILKKKKKNLFNRMHTAVHREGESVECCSASGHLNVGSNGPLAII